MITHTKISQLIFLKIYNKLCKNIRVTKQRSIKQHLLFRDSSHTLSANRFRVYHSLQYQNSTCYLEIVLICYLLTSSEFITHLPRISTSYTLDEYKWIVDFGKCILSLKNFFDAITTPLLVFWISFYRKLKVGDLVNPRQRISKFVLLSNLASHLLICNLDKTTNTYITITWMVQLGFNIRTSLILEICVLVFA